MSEKFINEEVKSAPRRARVLSVLCLVFLLVPNFNIIDILPDFVAYIILARFFGRYAEYAPYFAEAKEGFSKLAIVSALKIPALFLMMMSIGSGRDIVPLFTLIFAVIELILLYPAISSAFSALFHLGQRGVLDPAISEFTFLNRITTPDSARLLTYIFVTVKCALNFIPDTFLLTHPTGTNAEMLEALIIRSLFPVATAICMGAILILGVFWALMLYKYAMEIAAHGRIEAAAMEIAGEARLAELEGERSVKRILRNMTILAVSSLFCFDVAFTEINSGVSIIPHFLFALLIIALGNSICESDSQRRKLLIGGIAYSAISIVAYVLLLDFSKNHYYSDLGSIPAADTAYLYVEITALLELLCFIFFIAVYAKALTAYIMKHTTLCMSDGYISAPDEEKNKKMLTKSYIFALFPLLIATLKCANVFIRADVRYIIPENVGDMGLTTIVTSSVPWFNFVILGVTIAYAFFAYYFMNGAKDEVKLKYSNEKQSFE